MGAGSSSASSPSFFKCCFWKESGYRRAAACMAAFCVSVRARPYVSPGVTRVISRRFVVLGSPRTWVRAVLGGVVIRFLGLFPRFVGFLLSCSHVLFIDLFHGAFPLMFHRYDFAPDPPALTSTLHQIAECCLGSASLPSQDSLACVPSLSSEQLSDS
jgi:hypothetical protein